MERVLSSREPERVPCLVDCACFGPDGVCAAAKRRLDEFEKEAGWLVLILHGLDDAG